MRELTVACIGDSLTFGKGLAQKDAVYPEPFSTPHELQQLLDQRHPQHSWNVKNLGVGGSGVRHWVESLEGNHRSSRCPGQEIIDDLLAGCDIIIVMLGTNDAVKGHWNEQEYTSSLTRLARMLQSDCPTASLLLCSPPPIVQSGSFAQNLDADFTNSVLPRIIPQIAAGLGLVYIDCFHAVTANGISSDGVHLEPASYRTVASTMLDPVLRSIPSQGFTAAASVEEDEDELGSEEVEVEEVEESEEENLFFCLRSV
jgi:lysophospholipase L1-like esterase